MAGERDGGRRVAVWLACTAEWDGDETGVPGCLCCLHKRNTSFSLRRIVARCEQVGSSFSVCTLRDSSRVSAFAFQEINRRPILDCSDDNQRKGSPHSERSRSNAKGSRGERAEPVLSKPGCLLCSTECALRLHVLRGPPSIPASTHRARRFRKRSVRTSRPWLVDRWLVAVGGNHRHVDM